MKTNSFITNNHLSKKAIIYIRQSTMHQVLTHKESLKMQYSLKDQALQYGWRKEQIEIIDSDLGVTATSSENREGFKYILAEVALEKVGIIFSYDATRLSRNCSDWYQLLDICSFRGCLIGDTDSIYDPKVMNCRLLLGIKGQLAELELNTIKSRLIAGRDNKAKRGELAVKLPVGLVRHQKKVEKDPNLEVQHIINLLFSTFFRVKSASATLNFFNQKVLLIPRYNEFNKLCWKKPTRSDILCFLKNPAYAGTYAFGKTQSISCDKDFRKKRSKTMSQENWKYTIHNQYPCYISWEQYQQIQSILKENLNVYLKNSSGTPKKGSALLQGLVYCGKCGHKMVVEYNKGKTYICNHLNRNFGGGLCQTILAIGIDEKVTEAFFDVISDISLNAYDKIISKKEQDIMQLNTVREQKIKRLKYECQLAENRYNQADPNNRLVSDELEKRWESALIELKNAEQETAYDTNKFVPIPNDLKDAFIDIGKKLPLIWNKNVLDFKNKKQFLRCLIDKVVLNRVKCDEVTTRIVWKGGEVTALSMPLKVHALKDVSHYETIRNIIVTAYSEHKTDTQIAQILNERNFKTPSLEPMTSEFVQRWRLTYRIVRPRGGTNAPLFKGLLTIRQLCDLLNLPRYWIGDRIRNGQIRVLKHKQQGCYVFPNTKETVKKFKLLVAGKVRSLNFLKEY
ncbi:MAG: recombinase family protein [Gammaproteobacteria bacterium]|nr:recombinase family protein [Gammaproteobacteria bacterium]